jgi:hypothetical protein
VQKLSPTLYQIISTDYLSQNFFIMILAGWMIYFLDGLFGGGNNSLPARVSGNPYTNRAGNFLLAI